MKMEIMGTERALLGFLLAKIHKVDPDVIVVRRPIVLVNGMISCANICVMCTLMCFFPRRVTIFLDSI